MLAWNANSKRRSRKQQGMMSKNSVNNKRTKRATNKSLSKANSSSFEPPPTKHHDPRLLGNCMERSTGYNNNKLMGNNATRQPPSQSPPQQQQVGDIFETSDDRTNFKFPHRGAGISRDIHSLRRYATSSRIQLHPSPGSVNHREQKKDREHSRIGIFPEFLDQEMRSSNAYDHDDSRYPSPAEISSNMKIPYPSSIGESFGDNDDRIFNKKGRRPGSNSMNVSRSPTSDALDDNNYYEQQQYQNSPKSARGPITRREYGFSQKQKQFKKDANNFNKDRDAFGSNGNNTSALPEFFRKPQGQCSTFSKTLPEASSSLYSNFSNNDHSYNSNFILENDITFSNYGNYSHCGDETYRGNIGPTTDSFCDPDQRDNNSSCPTSQQSEQSLMGYHQQQPISPPRLNFSPPSQTYRLLSAEVYTDKAPVGVNMFSCMQEIIEDNDGYMGIKASESSKTSRMYSSDDQGEEHNFDFYDGSRGSRLLSSSFQMQSFQSPQHNTHAEVNKKAAQYLSPARKMRNNDEKYAEWKCPYEGVSGHKYDMIPTKKAMGQVCHNEEGKKSEKNIQHGTNCCGNSTDYDNASIDEKAIQFAVSSWGLFENSSPKHDDESALLSPNDRRTERISRFLNLDAEGDYSLDRTQLPNIGNDNSNSEISQQVHHQPASKDDVLSSSSDRHSKTTSYTESTADDEDKNELKEHGINEMSKTNSYDLGGPGFKLSNFFAKLTNQINLQPTEETPLHTEGVSVVVSSEGENNKEVETKITEEVNEFLSIEHDRAEVSLRKNNYDYFNLYYQSSTASPGSTTATATIDGCDIDEVHQDVLSSIDRDKNEPQAHIVNEPKETPHDDLDAPRFKLPNFAELRKQFTTQTQLTVEEATQGVVASEEGYTGMITDEINKGSSSGLSNELNRTEIPLTIVHLGENNDIDVGKNYPVSLSTTTTTATTSNSCGVHLKQSSETRVHTATTVDSDALTRNVSDLINEKLKMENNALVEVVTFDNTDLFALQNIVPNTSFINKLN